MDYHKMSTLIRIQMQLMPIKNRQKNNAAKITPVVARRINKAWKGRSRNRIRGFYKSFHMKKKNRKEFVGMPMAAGKVILS